MRNRGNQRTDKICGDWGQGRGGKRGGGCTPKPVTRTSMVQSLEGTASSSLLALCEPMLTCVWGVYRYNEWREVVEVVVKQRITPPWEQRARGHFTFRVSATNRCELYS